MTRCYFIRVELPDKDGQSYWWDGAPTLLETVARREYDKWCKRSGKNVLNVELWRRDERGEYCDNKCSLRTDLREKVSPAPPTLPETTQLELFAKLEVT